MTVLFGMPIINALAYAADAHNGQVRKGSNVPYLAHPLAVAAMILEFGGDEDLAIAGLLHDVIEDCDPIYAEKMQETFGARVYSIVRAMTDGVAGEDGWKAPWRERKEAYIASLRDGNPDVLLVKACDAMNNAAATLADVRRDGLAAFEKFRGGVDGTLWYYNEIARAVACTEAGDALRKIVDELAAEVASLVADSEGGEIE